MSPRVKVAPLAAAPRVAPLRLSQGHSVGELLQRRWQGTYEVDPWGLDPDLVALTDPLTHLRWHCVLRGAQHIPTEGPAVLMCSRRFGLSEPLVVAATVRREVGRQTRPVGAPDLDPIGPAMARFGGVPARWDELYSLLANHELVQIPLAAEPLRRGRAGEAPLELLGPVVAARVPVLPVAVVGRELGRRWKVVVGPPVPHPTARGPLATGELAERTRRAVQDLLDAEVTGFLSLH